MCIYYHKLVNLAIAKLSFCEKRRFPQNIYQKSPKPCWLFLPVCRHIFLFTRIASLKGEAFLRRNGRFLGGKKQKAGNTRQKQEKHNRTMKRRAKTQNSGAVRRCSPSQKETLFACVVIRWRSGIPFTGAFWKSLERRQGNQFSKSDGHKHSDSFVFWKQTSRKFSGFRKGVRGITLFPPEKGFPRVTAPTKFDFRGGVVPHHWHLVKNGIQCRGIIYKSGRWSHWRCAIMSGKRCPIGERSFLS